MCSTQPKYPPDKPAGLMYVATNLLSYWLVQRSLALVATEMKDAAGLSGGVSRWLLHKGALEKLRPRRLGSISPAACRGRVEPRPVSVSASRRLKSPLFLDRMGEIKNDVCSTQPNDPPDKPAGFVPLAPSLTIRRTSRRDSFHWQIVSFG